MYFIRSIQRKIKALLWIEVLFLLLLAKGAYSQTNSDYLESLEKEASELSLDRDTKNSQKASSANAIKLFSPGAGEAQGGAISDLSPGLSVEQFELVLKNNYIGSFLFYKRLSKAKKEKVYGFYLNNPDSDKVRQKILQVNKK